MPQSSRLSARLGHVVGYWHTATPSPEGQYAEGGLARVKRLMHNHVPPGVAVALTAMTVLCIPVC